MAHFILKVPGTILVCTRYLYAYKSYDIHSMNSTQQVCIVPGNDILPSTTSTLA